MLPTILVTGCNGQVGKELQLLSKQYLNYHFIFTYKEQLQVGNKVLIQEFFDTNKIDYCINCAAYTAVDKAETEKEIAFEINSLAPKYLAEICFQKNIKFIHISTDYVFDGTKKLPYTEEDLTNPINNYGYTKLDGEKNAITANPNSIIVRTSWVYSEFGNNFVKTMINLLKSKESINVINDQIGSPTYAASLAKILLVFVTKLNRKEKISGIFNFSSNCQISWFDFANEIKNNISCHCIINPIPTSQYPTPATRSLFSVLDKTKIITLLNIEFTDWKIELKNCITNILKT